ncbi:hypothetical protein NKH77_04795 [Streptomyces sp. M19]
MSSTDPGFTRRSSSETIFAPREFQPMTSVRSGTAGCSRGSAIADRTTVGRESAVLMSRSSSATISSWSPSSTAVSIAG